MPPRREHGRDSLEIIILGVLADRPLYGYAIIKQVAARSGGAMRLSAGVLYPLLHELEQDSLVQPRWEEVHSDRKPEDDSREGRRRKWYSITAKGRKRLAARVAAHRAQQQLIESFLPSDLSAGKESAA